MKKEVNVIVINLLCRKSRRLRILKLIALLKKASEQTNFPIVSVSILEAVDGVNQSFRQLEKRYGLKPFPDWAVSDDHSCALPSSWRSNQTSGGIASGLSHLDVAAHAVGNINKKDQLTLVMEDDCVFTVPPETAYTYFASCVEDAQDWDMIMLGASGMRSDIAPACEINSRFIEKAGFSYLTTMYWLSHEGAVKLVNNRKLCIENCLAFDELHNVLAGLTERVRSDVKKIFSSKTPIRLYSSKQSLVRQDPYDGVHDTVVIASCRENEDDVESPQLGRQENFELEKLIPVPLTVPGRIEMEIFWLRRRFGGRNLDMEKIRQDLGLKNNMSSALKRPRISGGLLAVLAKMRNEKLQSHPFERTLVYEFLKSCYCKKISIVLTGFGPFGDFTENPSSANLTGLNLDTYTHILPNIPVTSIGVEECISQISQYASHNRGSPVVVHFGVSAKAKNFMIELCAYNTDDPHARPVLETSLPVTLISNTVGGSVSTDPGRYFCNDLYFKSLKKRHLWQSIFVHVPPYSVMPQEQQRVHISRLVSLISSL